MPIAAIEDPSESEGEERVGYVFLAVDASTLDGEHEQAPSQGALYLVRTTPELEPLAHARVTPACADLRAWLYRVDDHVLVVHHEGAFPIFELFEGSSLESVGELKGMPGLTVPIRDALEREVKLIERTHTAFRVVRQPTYPEPPEAAESMPFLSAAITPRGACSQSPELGARKLYSRQVDPGLLKAVSAREDRARLITIAKSVQVLGSFAANVLEHTTSKLVLSFLWRAPEPENGFGFVQGAEHAVVLCPRDPEVVSRLETALEIYEDAPMRAHVLHLLGLAHLAAGRREAAVRAWRDGAAIEGHVCGFPVLLAIAGGLTEEELSEALPDVELSPFMAQHAARYEEAVAAMIRLDAALEAGRGEEAWAEARRVRRAVGSSCQLSARVALLHLDHPDPGADPWRYQLDLAWMASRGWLGPTRSHMVFAGCDWDHHRFTEIGKRAGVVIDAMGVGPASRPDDDDLEAQAQDGATAGEHRASDDEEE